MSDKTIDVKAEPAQPHTQAVRRIELTDDESQAVLRGMRCIRRMLKSADCGLSESDKIRLHNLSWIVEEKIESANEPAPGN